MPRIEAQIAKAYPAGPESAGFELDVTLEARDGVTALFGPSGAGKTLTLESIAGFVRPDLGRVRFDEETLFDSAARVDLPSRSRRCGYLFQRDALFPHMTVRQNLAFAAGSAADGPAENIDELLERFRIGHLSGRRPHEISGGERQRCSIARTLASRPRLLLMDEPGQGLDLGLRRELHQILRELRREYPMPMLLVTHDLWEALALADSMLVYAGGRIIQRGSPSEVYRRPDSLKVATLLGVENVFEGRVVSVSGGRMKLAAAGIQAEAAALAGRSAGDLVSFCIGSDAVRAIPCNGSSAAGATARLLATEDAGDRMRLLFEGGWSAALPRGEFEQYRNAEAWRIQVEDGAVWVFPEN